MSEPSAMRTSQQHATHARRMSVHMVIQLSIQTCACCCTMSMDICIRMCTHLRRRYWRASLVYTHVYTHRQRYRYTCPYRCRYCATYMSIHMCIDRFTRLHKQCWHASPGARSPAARRSTVRAPPRRISALNRHAARHLQWRPVHSHICPKLNCRRSCESGPPDLLSRPTIAIGPFYNSRS